MKSQIKREIITTLKPNTIYKTDKHFNVQAESSSWSVDVDSIHCERINDSCVFVKIYDSEKTDNFAYLENVNEKSLTEILSKLESQDFVISEQDFN